MSFQQPLNSASSAFKLANIQACLKRSLNEQQAISNKNYLTHSKSTPICSSTQCYREELFCQQKSYPKVSTSLYVGQQQGKEDGTKPSFGNNIAENRKHQNGLLEIHQTRIFNQKKQEREFSGLFPAYSKDFYFVAISVKFKNILCKTNSEQILGVKIDKRKPIKVANFINLIKSSLINKVNTCEMSRITTKTKIDELISQIEKISSFRTVQKSLDTEIDLIFSLKNYQLGQSFFEVINQKSGALEQQKILWLEPVYYNNNFQSKQLCMQDFQIIQFIGSGARNILTNVYCALKLILKEQIQDRNAEKIIQIQAKTLQTLNHPFITKLYSHFETNYFFVFAIQYCPGGQLFTRLRKVTHMDEEDAKFYFLQILLALNHMHQKGIIYRDIKPENILIDMYGQVRLADFGLSKNIKREKVAYSYCGSPEYMAPEMLKQTGHDQMLDYYCAACLLYQLVYSAPPFYSTNVQHIFSSIISNQIEFPGLPYTSNQFKDFIRQLLHKNPQERLGRNGISEILNHPFLQQNWGKKGRNKGQELKGMGYKQRLLKSAPFIPQPFVGEIIVSSGQDEGQENSQQVQRIRKYEQFLQKQMMQQSGQFKLMSNEICSSQKDKTQNSRFCHQQEQSLQQRNYMQGQQSQQKQLQKQAQWQQKKEPYSLTLSQSDNADITSSRMQNQLNQCLNTLAIDNLQDKQKQAQSYYQKYRHQQTNVSPKLINMLNPVFGTSQNTMTQRKNNQKSYINHEKVANLITTYQFSKRKTNIGLSDFDDNKGEDNICKNSAKQSQIVKDCHSIQPHFKHQNSPKYLSQNNQDKFERANYSSKDKKIQNAVNWNSSKISNILYFNLITSNCGKKIKLNGGLSNYRYFNNHTNSDKSLHSRKEHRLYNEISSKCFKFSQFKSPLDNGIYKLANKGSNNPFYLV